MRRLSGRSRKLLAPVIRFAIFTRMQDSESLSAQLLSWYDRHARVMPWRVSPQDRAAGIRPDPIAGSGLPPRSAPGP